MRWWRTGRASRAGVVLGLAVLLAACSSDRVDATLGARCTGAADCTDRCLPAGADFPGGMCSRGDCASAGAGETCGAIAVLQGFNDCLAQGRPFAQCLEQNVRPAVQQACDAQTACRDDYICSRTPSGKGACIPPYFLFQLRVDGHPAP